MTHEGTVKAVNEDRVVAKAPVFLVADGVSGCRRGALASELVAERFNQLADRADLPPELVAEAVEAARACLCGSRAAGVSVGGQPYWTMVNSGDSRIYRVSGGSHRMDLVTEDHTHVQAMLALGLLTPELAARHPDRHVLSQAVGSPDQFDPDYWLLPIVAGDRLLLCSDCLLGETDLEEIERIVVGQNTPEDAVVELLSLALAAGARDNVSAVIVDVDGADWRREIS